MTNGNEPAMPIVYSNDSHVKPGMTIREAFAMAATVDIPDPTPDTEDYYISHWSKVSGVISPEEGATTMEWHKFWTDVEAALKVQKAEALIKALNQKGGEE